MELPGNACLALLCDENPGSDHGDGATLHDDLVVRFCEEAEGLQH